MSGAPLGDEFESSKRSNDQEPQQPPFIEKICDLVIELSLLGLLCIAFLSKSQLSTGEYAIVAGTLLTLTAILLTRRLEIIRSPLGILGISFFFMFIFTLTKQTSIRYELSSQTIMLIPASTIILLAGLIGWIFKITTQKEAPAGPSPKSETKGKSPSQREIVHPYSLAVGFLILFSLGIFIPLQHTYQLEYRVVKEAFHLIIAFVLLLALISFNITSASQSKSVVIYVIVACLGILVKSALVYKTLL